MLSLNVYDLDAKIKKVEEINTQLIKLNIEIEKNMKIVLDELIKDICNKYKCKEIKNDNFIVRFLHENQIEFGFWDEKWIARNTTDEKWHILDNSNSNSNCKDVHTGLGRVFIESLHEYTCLLQQYVNNIYQIKDDENQLNVPGFFNSHSCKEDPLIYIGE